MKVKIVTPEKVIYEGDSSYITFKTDQGEEVILDGHSPYISRVKLGELRYKEGDTIHPYAVSSGFCEIKDNIATIVIDNALHTKDIDIQKAEEAKRRAQEELKQTKNLQETRILLSRIQLANLHITTGRKYSRRNFPSNSEPGNNNI